MLILIRCLFHPHVTAVAHNRHRSFCQKCRWQVTPKHAYTLDPKWADFAAVQAQCRNLSGNELTRNLSGNTWPQSSQLAEPLWTGPGLKSGISVHELISISPSPPPSTPPPTHPPTHPQKAHAGNERSNILPKSSQARKKPPPPPSVSLSLFLLQQCSFYQPVNKQTTQLSNARVSFHLNSASFCGGSWANRRGRDCRWQRSSPQLPSIRNSFAQGHVVQAGSGDQVQQQQARAGA